MQLPIVAPAPLVTAHAGIFRDLFENRCQFQHFQNYLARIIHEPKKPTEEGALGSRMMLKTAVSQEHHNPKTNASACPGTVQVGLMVAIGHNASRQPPQASRKLCAPESLAALHSAS